jgi:hypothetical protein
MSRRLIAAAVVERWIGATTVEVASSLRAEASRRAEIPALVFKMTFGSAYNIVFLPKIVHPLLRPRLNRRIKAFSF